MQHRHIHEAVNRTFCNICGCEDKVFGGLTVVFGGDFKQILPVIVKGSRPEIIGAKSLRLLPSIQFLKLTENMRLNTHNIPEHNLQNGSWMLDMEGTQMRLGQSLFLTTSNAPKIQSILASINYPFHLITTLLSAQSLQAEMMMLTISIKHCSISFLKRRQNS